MSASSPLPVGVVFDVQRSCLHDGPGIRTVIFLKGCALRCRWCENPESLRTEPELYHTPRLCVGCGSCARACPRSAIAVRQTSGVDWSRCDQCLRCVERCPSGALRAVGRTVTVNEAVESALADRAYYARSGGGVTLSGGEPALQFEFAAALLKAIRAEGVSTAIETAGAVATGRLLELARLADLVYFDLKGARAERHRDNTGAVNDLILRNAAALADAGGGLVYRLVVAPTRNDAPEDVAAMREVLSRLRAREVQLLPYHPLGAGKLHAIAPVIEPVRIPESTPAALEALRDALSAPGRRVTVGGG